jgi:ABC-type uncharacterized transport system permease subunit
METPQGFFTTLFDFSFSEFIVPKIVKILFGLGILGAAIMSLTMIVKGFNAGVLAGLLMIILSPVFFVIGVILARVYLEVIMVLFRIADNTTKMVQENKE